MKQSDDDDSVDDSGAGCCYCYLRELTFVNWVILTEWEQSIQREPLVVCALFHYKTLPLSTLFRSILGCWVEERGEEKKKMRREWKLTGWRWAKCYYKIDIGFWLYIILSFTLLFFFFTVILQVLLFASIFQTLQFLFSCLNTLFSPSCLSISVHTVFLMRLNYLTLRLCDY